jgi:DNA-binding FadR family transcriptional regulator
MPHEQALSPFLRYLAHCAPVDGLPQLPSLSDLSAELGVSISVLREQLEVAKALELVEVKPRTGIRRLPFNFSPAVSRSLAYSLELSPDHFRAFADLRNRLEASYWEEAVRLLTPQDHSELCGHVNRAWEKLRGTPVQIPHEEHRQFHLGIYRRLENPYVLGILEAYWIAYEAIGLSLYTDYDYLRQVWDYHQQMLDAICSGDIQAGYKALVTHRDLLFHRPDGAVVEPSPVRADFPQSQALTDQG